MNLARAISNVAIPPLYYVGERTNVLRGTPLRSPVQRALRTMSTTAAFAARRAFVNALPTGKLPIEQLESMLAANRTGKTRKDRRGPEDKYRARAAEVLRGSEIYLPHRATVLDLACGDGGVGEQMQLLGHRVHGADLRTPAKSPIIKFDVMDAAKLTYANDTFDLVYSFDAFEHFADPAAVLNEAHRVLRPGGIFYASFGPLFHSAMGAHQWFSIDLPYVHLLFDRDATNDYADRIGKPRLTPNLNFWSLKQFRRLFDGLGSQFRTLGRFEKYNVAFVDRVTQYAGTFAAQVSDFDELIVRSIEITLRKKG